MKKGFGLASVQQDNVFNILESVKGKAIKAISKIKPASKKA